MLLYLQNIAVHVSYTHGFFNVRSLERALTLTSVHGNVNHQVWATQKFYYHY